MGKNNEYILITAAKNEERFIGKTIESVIAQTLLPAKWYIISDNSSDKTDEIVLSYTKIYSFISLIRREQNEERNFGSKAKCIMDTYNNIQNLKFSFIGNLDADISLPIDYYEKILSIMHNDDKVGIAGGIRLDFCDGKYVKVPCAFDSVGGPFQFFKKECFEAIGGYLQLKYGGIDIVAETKAKILGWKVRSYPNIISYHQRCTGTGGGNLIKNRKIIGYKLYTLGYKPIPAFLKFSQDMLKRPRVIGSLISAAAYTWALINKFEKMVDLDFINFINTDQRKKIMAKLRWGK